VDTIILKPGRDKSLRRHHPWIFSGAIASIKGDPKSGDTIQVIDSTGEFLAYGAYSPESQIRIRVWSWDKNERINLNFFCNRLKDAIDFRLSSEIFNQFSIDYYQDKGVEKITATNAYRLVYAESDNLPGLIVDRYGDTLVIQVLSAGIETWRDTIADILMELTDARHIYERSDVEVRKLEGLKERTGPLRGNPPDSLVIHENDLQYKVSLSKGHKTGYYLDQRTNRRHIQALANGRDVLDCFSYTGSFSLNALKGGANSVVAVDVSSGALELAQENLSLNQLPPDRVKWLEADVFQQMRKFRDQGMKFDMVILDPPKFAPTSSLVQKASRGYKDINLLAFKLLRPGGILATFSCSGALNPSLFQKIVADAAVDAAVNAKVFQHLSQSSDHPIGLYFPEGAYLKGLLIRI
jgi:23S rRNA (cytosine1962-C5)-methyltransferase